MAMAVVLERMAAAHDLACEIRVSLHAFANAEKGGLDSVIIEQAEDSGS